MAPQVLQVLLCVSCKTFQVHIVKKAKKWECKICGTKQTLLQVYGTGTGPDCRQIVQKLNEARGLEQASPLNNSSTEYPIEEGSIEEISLEQQETTSKPQSKWDVYLDNGNN